MDCNNPFGQQQGHEGLNFDPPSDVSKLYGLLNELSKPLVMVCEESIDLLFLHIKNESLAKATAQHINLVVLWNNDLVPRFARAWHDVQETRKVEAARVHLALRAGPGQYRNIAGLNYHKLRQTLGLQLGDLSKQTSEHDHSWPTPRGVILFKY